MPRMLDMGKVAAGAVFSGVSGQFDGVIVSNAKGGLVVKRPARYRKSQSPAQVEAAARFKAATEVWNGLGAAEAAAWDAYAQTVVLHNKLTGGAFHPSGFNAFCALATKVLQVDPLAVVPVLPPVGVFVGDSLELAVGSLPLAVVYEASGPNTPGTVTEFLVEKLPNERRKPTGRLASAGFFAFTVHSLEFTVNVDPGWYLAGYRYIEVASGRQTLAQAIRQVEVGPTAVLSRAA